MINKRTFLLVIIASSILVGRLYGQKYSLLFFESNQCVDLGNFQDSTSVNAYLDALLSEDLDNGYFYAGYDSILFQDSLVSAYYNRGKAYVWGNIQIVSDSNELLFSKIIAKWKKHPPSAKRMQAYMQELTEKFNEIGYANCQISSKKIVPHTNLLDWELIINTGPIFILDSIEVSSKQSFPEEIIEFKSGLYPGSTFNFTTLKALDAGKFDPDFSNQEKPMQLTMSDSSYSIKLSYESTKRNSISGMLGIVPGNESENLYLTGDMKLNLENALRAGEKIALNWQAYEKNSQMLQLNYKQPVIIGPLGFNGHFLLDKQDTSFLNTDLKIGIYAIQRNAEISVYYKQVNSQLIEASVDDLNSFKHRLLGLQYNYNGLDNKYNPRKGVAYNLEMSIGLKYKDSLDIDKGVGVFNADINTYFNIANRFGGHASNSIALRYIKDGLMQNEMFRIGGVQSLRGYMDRSIYTSSYNITSFEFLFYPDNYSSVYAFYDVCLLNSTDNILEFNLNTISSTGVGTRINTNLGIIDVIYAIPYNSNASFDFRQSKIHIGYVNNF